MADIEAIQPHVGDAPDRGQGGAREVLDVEVDEVQRNLVFRKPHLPSRRPPGARSARNAPVAKMMTRLPGPADAKATATCGL